MYYKVNISLDENLAKHWNKHLTTEDIKLPTITNQKWPMNQASRDKHYFKLLGNLTTIRTRDEKWNWIRMWKNSGRNINTPCFIRSSQDILKNLQTEQSHAQASTREYTWRVKRSVFYRNYIPMTIMASFTTPKTDTETSLSQRMTR